LMPSTVELINIQAVDERISEYSITSYLVRGSEVFGCLLDCQKAFDTVEHKKIFQKLSNRIPVIFVRIMLVIYIGQK
jgi:hypothetical protein